MFFRVTNLISTYWFFQQTEHLYVTGIDLAATDKENYLIKCQDHHNKMLNFARAL